MMYSNLKIGDKELKLRLNTRMCVELERKLGCSPIELLMEVDAQGNPKMPKLENLITILHASLQAYEHGYNIDKTYELYDEFVDNGGTLAEMIPAIMEIFKVSGFFKEEDIKAAEAEAGKKAPQKAKKKA